MTLGLYKKYRVEKTDGTPIDPNAVYFVLRLDTDCHARRAINAYIESCQEENPQLADELSDILDDITGRAADV